MESDIKFAIISYFSGISVFVPLVFFYFFGINSQQLRWVFLYVIVSVIFETTSFIEVKFLRQSNIELYNVYTFFQLGTLGNIYFLGSSWNKRALLLPFFLLILLLVIVFSGKIYFYTVINCTEPLIFCFLSVRYFITRIKNLEHMDFFSNYLNWLNIGVLFYFGVTSFLLIFEGSIRLFNPTISSTLWMIQMISNIIFHTILSLSIWKKHPV